MIHVCAVLRSLVFNSILTSMHVVNTYMNRYLSVMSDRLHLVMFRVIFCKSLWYNFKFRFACSMKAKLRNCLCFPAGAQLLLIARFLQKLTTKWRFPQLAKNSSFFVHHSNAFFVPFCILNEAEKGLILLLFFSVHLNAVHISGG